MNRPQQPPSSSLQPAQPTTKIKNMLEQLSRSELQLLAKEHNLKANAKSVRLISQLSAIIDESIEAKESNGFSSHKVAAEVIKEKSIEDVKESSFDEQAAYSEEVKVYSREEMNIKEVQVCECCDATNVHITGCSCLGGNSSHECKHPSKYFLTAARVKEALSAHFTEINLTGLVYEYIGASFVSTWEVGLVLEPESTCHATWKDNNQPDYVELAMCVTLPLSEAGTYDFQVDWGDGSAPEHITCYDEAEHEYDKAGRYDIRIDGTLKGFTFRSRHEEHKTGNRSYLEYVDYLKWMHEYRLQIVDISQWGCVGLEGKNGSQFAECVRLAVSATDVPDLSNVTNMSAMFAYVSKFNCDVSKWNTSNVLDMSRMFYHVSSFNGDVSRWNTSKVTDTSRMFSGCCLFNCDLSRWNTSNITNMMHMLSGASSFNGSLSGWDTNNVTNMDSMLLGCDSFTGHRPRLQRPRVTPPRAHVRPQPGFNKEVMKYLMRCGTPPNTYSFCTTYDSDGTLIIPRFRYATDSESDSDVVVGTEL